ncbi:NAD(P)H-binding protein [Streptomyces sp. NPDC004533]|uniref:NAD(P)H-binding protein n=1 Tax=Streptomyces sp. NPDC004533 TaxID=3154278 RepID=UPI0033B84DD8
MAKPVIFGAGDNVGRMVVREALRRGHAVTAVVRDPARLRGLSADGARVEAGRRDPRPAGAGPGRRA